MENLVGKTKNDSAQKCNSGSLFNENKVEFQENASSNSDIPVNNINLRQTGAHTDLTEKKDSSNSAEVSTSRNCSGPMNLEQGKKSFTSLASPHSNRKECPFEHTDDVEKGLVINITSNCQNAIKQDSQSSGNIFTENSSSDTTKDENRESQSQNCGNNVKEVSASLLSLSVYESDSDETDMEEKEIQQEGYKTQINGSGDAKLTVKNFNLKKEASDSLCNYAVFSETSSEDSSSDSESSNEQENNKEKAIINTTCYRKNEESSSESETDTTEDSDNEEEVEEEVSVAASTKSKQKPFEGLRVKGELTLDDLPPVPDLSTLKIDVKEEECVQMGTISSIVDKLVMVQSLPNVPAYDVDTLLFLENGKRPLGQVYDVIGPVSCPMYAVRFNSRQEIDAKGISKDLPVFSAPKSEHTQYVFLKELLRIKGSDASWQGDSEVPPEFADFSDDEEEFNATNCTNDEYELHQNKRKRNSLEKHQLFEMEMNQRNKLDSAYHRLKDSCEPRFKKSSNSSRPTHSFGPFSDSSTYSQPTTTLVAPNQPPTFGILQQPRWSFVPSIPPPPPPAGFGLPPFFQNHLCQPFPTFAGQVLAFPPLNVPPPPCGAPPTLPQMSVPPPPIAPHAVPPPPPPQLLQQALRPAGTTQTIKRLPASSPTVQVSVSMLAPPPVNLGYSSTNVNVTQVEHVRKNGSGHMNGNTPQPQAAKSNNGHGQTQEKLQCVVSQNSKATVQSIPVQQLPLPQRPSIQNVPPPLQNVPPPSLAAVPLPNFQMQPIFQPFPSRVQPPSLPLNDPLFRSHYGNSNCGGGSGGNGSTPKSQPCPLPYPPCMGLPKFTTPPPPSVTSNNAGSGGHLRPTVAHFSGGTRSFNHNQPPPPPQCSQNGRGRFNFNSQTACGYFRKQF